MTAAAMAKGPPRPVSERLFAAAALVIGLALVLQLYRRFQTLDTDAASEMKG